MKVDLAFTPLVSLVVRWSWKQASQEGSSVVTAVLRKHKRVDDEQGQFTESMASLDGALVAGGGYDGPRFGRKGNP